MNKKKENQPVEETQMVTSEASDQLPKIDGFDMSIYVAKPYETQIVTKREIVRVPVKKPGGQIFFRIHPTEEIPVWLLKWEDDGEQYVINPKMLKFLDDQAKLNILYLGITLSGHPFLFPVQQKDANGKWNSWHESAFNIITMAKKQWLRMVAERQINGYEPYVAEQKHPEPEWPQKTMMEYLAIAFREKRIDTEDHPIIKSLKGK